VVFFPEHPRSTAVGECIGPYHGERDHPMWGNERIEEMPPPWESAGEVACVRSLGGVLRPDRRSA
jgi:hypothetical protein